MSTTASSPQSPPCEPTSPRGPAALLLIDIQNDFCEGGALAVPEGSHVVPLANALRAARPWDLVVLSQDWHPPSHASFAVNNPGAALFSLVSLPSGDEQVMWPAHCVQGSRGAEFHSDLHRAPADVVVQKGSIVSVDSYSAFGDAFQSRFENTGLNKLLRDKGVTYVVVVGLALDFCVNYTCLDARRLGFVTYLVLSGCRAVYPANADKVVKDLEAVGVIVVKDVKDLPEEVFPPGSSLA